MTQKELLYVEDAVMHETSIISILEEFVSNLSSDELRDFIQAELEKHNENKQDLMNLLEEKANE